MVLVSHDIVELHETIICGSFDRDEKSVIVEVMYSSTVFPRHCRSVLHCLNFNLKNHAIKLFQDFLTTYMIANVLVNS